MAGIGLLPHGLNLLTLHSPLLQHQGHRILGMFGCHRLPGCGIQMSVKPWQDHGTLGMRGNGFQQITGGGVGAG